MPYIKSERRVAIGRDVTMPKTSGELNFLFTEIIRDYIHYHGLNYQHINDVLGALEGAKQEFYRRIAAPYEDEKIKENGDVY